MLCWVGDESQSHKTGLLDMSFQSLAQHGDAFGDEDRGFDILGSDYELIRISFFRKEHHVLKRKKNNPCVYDELNCC